jgi:probable DNA metabolism protein
MSDRMPCAPARSPVRRAFRHDGGFDAWAAALEAAAADPAASIIRGPGDPADLFDREIPVSATPGAARRIFGAWRERVSKEFVRHLLHAHARGDAESELPAYARLGLDRGAAVDQYHAHPAVAAVLASARATRAELHRLKGLIRFRDRGDGRLWGPYESEADVLWSLAGHFVRRQPDDRWVLHDVGRHRAVAWEGGDLREIESPGAAEPSGRDEVADLWRAFYRGISVPGRENPALRARNMPRRYWRWLVELEEAESA